jgi:hypothetical protein
MDVNRQRSSNLGLCYLLIGLGAFFILGTIAAAIHFRDSMTEKVKEPLSTEGITFSNEINIVDMEIQFKEQQIRTERTMSETDESLRQAREKLNKKTGGKNTANTNFPTSGQSRADKIRKLEDERAQLIAKKEELTKKLQEKNAPRRTTWRDWFENYDVELFLVAVFPLGIFTIFIGRMTFISRLPERNPFAMTDFERRCLLFVAFAMIFSMLIFALFFWFLRITS